MKKTEIDLDKLKDDWPSPFVARDKIEEFTKWMYKSRSMRTLDSADEGEAVNTSLVGSFFI